MQWGQKKPSGLNSRNRAFAAVDFACSPRSAVILAIGVGAALFFSSPTLGQTAGSSTASQAQAAAPAAPMSDAEKRIAADLLFKRLLIKPDDLDAGFRYAELETELADYEAAIGALERITRICPG